MEDKRCFVEGCTLDVEYTCPCSLPDAYVCTMHTMNHLDIPNKTHAMTSIFVEPCKGTREAILKFLAKMGSKHRMLKEKVLACFSRRIFDERENLEELIKEIDSYSDDLNNCFTKISQANRIKKSEQDSVLGLLSLQPDEAVENLKSIIPSNPDWYDSAKVFYGLSQKIEKMIELFIKEKFEDYLDNRLAKIESALGLNDKNINLANSEIANLKDSISNIIIENKKSLREFEFWKQTINMKAENEASLLNSQIITITEDLSRLKQAENQRQKDISAAQNLLDKRTEALDRPNDAYLEQEFRIACIGYENNCAARVLPFTQAYQYCVETYNQKTSLYNIIEADGRTSLLIYNTEAETKREKIIPETLDSLSCITQLPSGKLFCYGKNYPLSGITLIIDKSGGVEVLPSGTPCRGSSSIYFNNCVYCFGGHNGKYLTLSSRFDLNRIEWVKLVPLPMADAYCNSIIFNGSILISGVSNRNLVRYSIDSSSFTTIPYQFAKKKRKILINGERLYLIECEKGSIYESEIGSDSAWRRIADSTTSFWPDQTYCSYNKGGVYIGCIDGSNNKICYVKFNLSDKSLTRLS